MKRTLHPIIVFFVPLKSNYGLKTTSSALQQVMNVVVTEVQGQFALACLKDNVIFSRTADEHIDISRSKTKIDVTTQRRRDIKFKNVNFLWITLITTSIILAWALRSTNAHDFHHTRTQTPDYSVETRIIFGPVQRIPTFVPGSSRITVPSNKKVQKGEWQSSDRLAINALTALETIKVRLVEPPYSLFPSCKATTQ